MSTILQRADWLRVAALLIAATFFAATAINAQEEPDQDLPLVYVLATGGTIAGSSQGMLPYEALLEAVPVINDHARMVGEQVASVGSSNLSIENWLTIANRVNEIFATDPDAAGVVITHGTDTIEETAYFLNLVIDSDKPVVLVGAMRNASALSADGPQNLYMGVLTAISERSVGKGVLLVLNDEVHGAREVTKTNTLSLDTFESEFGILGYVRDPSGPHYYRTSTRRHTSDSEFDVTGMEDLPRVDIVYTYLGVDGTQIRAAVEAGAEGVVIAAVGHANMASAMREVATSIYEEYGVPVVYSNRTGAGRIAPRNDNLLAQGVIGGDNLNPQKARILLMLALTATDDPFEMQRMFNEY